MSRSGFREREVWRRARDVAIVIYKTTGDKSYARDLSLRVQMRRAALSISSNIAEGDERNTDKEAVRFFYSAKGSLAELITQLEISKAVNLINAEDFQRINAECETIGKMPGKLIKFRHPR